MDGDRSIESKHTLLAKISMTSRSEYPQDESREMVHI